MNLAVVNRGDAVGATAKRKGKGLLMVLSAPSGGGKTTICDALLKKDRNLYRSISATTREPRGREKSGQDYYFLSPARFEALLGKNRFLESAQVHDHYYGTLKREVFARQRAGTDVVMVIDVQGGLQVKAQYPEAILIFVAPPSLEILRQRLQKRGTDSLATIRRRLHNARGEMKQANVYDYRVVNQVLKKAICDVGLIIAAERLRIRRMK